MATNWKIGDRIQNRWHIYRILKGGMGTVYVVFDIENNSIWAAKTFQTEVFARDPSVADRFRQEAVAWVNLGVHQNVVEARMVHHIEGQPFLFLEYVIGSDLSRWIGAPLLLKDLSQVLHLAIQCCDGMIHVLASGIKAHRDIKPQNCLVTLDRTLKVTDFGLAKVFDNACIETADELTRNDLRLSIGLTGTGVAAGTPTHMAPEQFDDARHVDVRADIYSFGVMLFQMLTGQLPFIAGTWREFERVHKTLPPPLLGVRHPALRAVVDACLAKDPSRRCADFGSVREQLATIYEELTGKSAPRPVTGTELDAKRWADKGTNLCNLGRHEDALVCLKRALELDPRDWIAWSSKGAVLSQLGRKREALADIDRAIELNPRSENSWANKAKALCSEVRYDEAITCCEQALALNPNFLPGWTNKAGALVRLERFDEALICYDRVLELDPRNADIWAEKSEILHRLERHEEARACCQHAVDTNPQSDVAWFYQGVSFEALGQADEALRCYDLACTINARRVELWVNKGTVLGKLGRNDEAIACFDRALDLEPGLGQAWMNKGAILGESGRIVEAQACFEEAQRLDHPRAREAMQALEQMAKRSADRVGTLAQRQAAELLQKGMALRTSHPAEAVICFTRALELDPHNARTWYYQGMALGDLDRHEEAIKCYDRATELDPSNANVFHNKGVAYGASERYAEAVGCFDRALELDPRDAATWYNKGGALDALGRPADAVACFDRAIELDPADAYPWFYKGMTLCKGLERFSDALPCFDEALRRGHPQAAKAQAACRRILQG